MEIRPYQEAALPELLVFLNETHRDSYEFIPCVEEKLREELTDAELVLVAAQGDVLLGFGLWKGSGTPGSLG